MPVHPIEQRYGSQAMRSIFEPELRLQRMLEVEAALAQALAEVGMIPTSDAQTIAEKASLEHVRLERVQELEREVGHEVMALVLTLAEACGEAGRFIHLGATSNDVLDTALALQLKEALAMVEQNLKRLLSVVLDRALEHKETIEVGRTHGQHALPITFGLKLAVWACELGRHLERLQQLKPRVLVGKMSGAVGTGAAWGAQGPRVQRLVMKRLGLGEPLATTQVVGRDRLAELLGFLGLLGCTLDKMAREVRNLQRTELGEVEEPFRRGQVGSSTMPHKRNPVRCERVSGLARVLRANVQAALENVALEHERDLTNSSCERVLIPECFLLVDEMLNTTLEVFQGLVVHPKRMEQNLRLLRGLNLAEAVMVELTKRGMDRQEAHRLLSECCSRALEAQEPLEEVLKREAKITELISPEKLGPLLDPRNYLGSAVQIVELVEERLRPQTK